MLPRFLAAAIIAAPVILAAQVPVHKDPHHTVTFENAQFRIMNVNIPAGATGADHRHEFDVATVSMLNGGETRAQSPGQPWTVRAPRALGHVSVTEYAGKPGSHRLQNSGKVPYQLFAVENLKKSGWSTAAPATGAATTKTLESRAFAISDVRLAGNTTQSQHKHAVPTLVILINGKAMSDGPDDRAKELAPAPVGLRQLDQPGQWILVPAGDTHHLVRLGTADTRIVEVELR